MNHMIINEYKANEENYNMAGCFTAKEMEKAFVECIGIGDGYVFCYSKARRINDSEFHRVSLWKQDSDGDFNLICRAKNELNVMDLSEQIAWMKDVAKRHMAA